MGHVDREDLLNVIRHELRLEDDDGPGLCSRLLLNPDRKCRAGGLPLDFRLKNGDLMDDGDAGFDDIYEVRRGFWKKCFPELKKKALSAFSAKYFIYFLFKKNIFSLKTVKKIKINKF